MRFTARKWVGAALAAAVIATGGVLATPERADATAMGSTSWGGFNIGFKGQSIRIPAGAVHHGIRGSGRKVSVENMNMEQLVAGPICNYQNRIQHKKVNGTIYNRVTGRVYSVCTWGETKMFSIKPGTLKYYGKACAQAWIGGKARATQCHNITK